MVSKGFKSIKVNRFIKNTQEIILKKYGLYEMWWNLVCSRNTISEIYLLVILKEECNVNIVIYSLYVKVNIFQDCHIKII